MRFSYSSCGVKIGLYEADADFRLSPNDLLEGRPLPEAYGFGLYELVSSTMSGLDMGLDYENG